MTSLKDRFLDFWAQPDRSLQDAGSSAELLIAQVRLALTATLLVIPILHLILGPAGEGMQHLISLGMMLGVVAIAGLAWWLVRRERHERWLPFATSLMDVSLVTAALLTYSIAGDPHRAINSDITFEVYFLAIGLTGLRYDLRLSVIAGSAAVLQYALVLYVAAGLHDLDSARYAPWTYGRFDAGEQVSRLLLLVLQTILCTVFVHRLRRHRRQSNSDRLTGLFNRAYFEEFLAAEVRRSERYARLFAVAMVDVDHFKQFNDTYGHAAGDHALRLVADTLKRLMRRSDLVARYGGEELVLVMPETTLDAATRRLEAIREAVALTPLGFPGGNSPMRVTVSAGVAAWPQDGLDGEKVVTAADLRLFRAKALGRNRVVSSTEVPVPV
jgi:diguanylate cyclase (GGDEF)-like protein